VRALRQLKREITLIVISHRVKSLGWADRFVLMESGAISAPGDHSRLVHDGFYRALIESDPGGGDCTFIEHVEACERRQMRTTERKTEGSFGLTSNDNGVCRDWTVDRRH
jgi:energy-coupling factor transporter ATP-binding protein EcfA2